MEAAPHSEVIAAECTRVEIDVTAWRRRTDGRRSFHCNAVSRRKVGKHIAVGFVGDRDNNEGDGDADERQDLTELSTHSRKGHGKRGLSRHRHRARALTTRQVLG